METLITPNEKQKECIENIEGRYLVLAGPGTGKTFTIAHRIKHMLELGINPERILCLTFTEAAQNEMKNKIKKALNGKDLGVNVYTYHSFCNSIISDNTEEFDLSDNVSKISDSMSRKLLKECIDEYDAKEYRNQKNNPYVYFNIISSKISEIKKNRLTKEQYLKNIKENPDWEPQLVRAKEIIDEKKAQNKKILVKDIQLLENTEKNIKKALEIWEFYELYEKKKEALGYIDYDDMICLVLDKFESSSLFLDNIANKYDYILVDEYQDTNKLQYKIVTTLAHALKSNNIFVVGDDDQIIYSFQGANLDTIENFLNEFPDTKVICLKENMRSTQSILDFSRKIALQDKRRLETNPKFAHYGIDKELIAMNKDIIAFDKKVKLCEYKNQKQEFLEIANIIENEIIPSFKKQNEGNNKNPLSQIAIITTSNDELKEFEKIFHDRNIPCELKEGKSIFEINSFSLLFSYLQMLANPELYSDKILKSLLLPPFEVHPLDFVKILDNISKNKTLIETIKEINSWHKGEKIEKFLSVYEELLEYQANENLRNVIMEVGFRTGIFEYFINEKINRKENISAFIKLISEAQDFSKEENKTTLSEFVEYLLMVQNDRDIDIKTDKPDIDLNAIQLTTYHSSKGREYEYVFMPSLQKSKWESKGGSFKPSIPVSKEEWRDSEYWREYRISDRIKTLYVGLTRAKHSLFLSYTGDSSLCSEWIMNVKDMCDFSSMSEYDEKEHEKIEILSLEKRPYNYKRDFSDYIDTKLRKKHSATSLNTYLRCKRAYLYEKILNFTPRYGFMDAANYGSAMHDALLYMIKDDKGKKRTNYVTLDDFIKKFKKSLNNLPISTPEMRKIYEGRGESELKEYYHHMTDFPIDRVYDAEYEFGKKEDSLFMGFIDKIEKNEDGTYTIIDYKTSDPKIKKEITLKGEHSDYFHQICLYKYCFEKETGNIVSNLAFVFPLGCTKYELPPDITADYEQAIEDYKNAIKGIEEHDFEPPKTKDERTQACRYCIYKDFCSLDRV